MNKGKITFSDKIGIKKTCFTEGGYTLGQGFKSEQVRELQHFFHTHQIFNLFSAQLNLFKNA